MIKYHYARDTQMLPCVDLCQLVSFLSCALSPFKEATESSVDNSPASVSSGAGAPRCFVIVVEVPKTASMKGSNVF